MADGVTRCSLCEEPVVRHPGNGGQWIGARPPRDWMTCHGGDTYHVVRIPDLTDTTAVEEWISH